MYPSLEVSAESSLENCFRYSLLCYTTTNHREDRGLLATVSIEHTRNEFAAAETPAFFVHEIGLHTEVGLLIYSTPVQT